MLITRARGGLLGVAQRPARQGQEHVVERRAVHLDGVQVDAGPVQVADQAV
jgi:hypothetical protein